MVLFLLLKEQFIIITDDQYCGRLQVKSGYPRAVGVLNAPGVVAHNCNPST